MKTDSDECVSFRDVARPDSGLARYLRLNAQSAAKPICVRQCHVRRLPVPVRLLFVSSCVV